MKRKKVDAQAVIDKEAEGMPLIEVNTMEDWENLPANAYFSIAPELAEKVGLGEGDDPETYLDGLTQEEIDQIMGDDGEDSPEP